MKKSLKKLRVGIAGLGTVGRGVYEIINKDQKLLQDKTGVEIEVVAVSARNNKDFIDKKIKFYENPLDLADDENVDVVVELIGGVDVAKELILKALKNSKKVVTANKALIAIAGAEIAKVSEEYNSAVLFEASVAGANPIIKVFREGFSANEIKEVYAILNGTCNFILTKMTNEKQDYFATLKQAQELGYAEADPTFDVEGIDSAHKITILSSLASPSLPNFNMFIEGISKVSDLDIVIADELGYKIKLLAIYKNFGDSIEQTVYPALIAKNEKIAQIDGSYNCVLTLGNNCEYNMMIGRGAGGLTTGSAVVADIVDIACNRQNDLLFNSQLADLKTVKIKDIKTRIGKYFIKFNFTKNHLGEKKFVEKNFKKIFNIEKIIYKKINDEQFVCGLITDNIKEQDLLDSLADIDSSIINQLSFLRVEETKF
jgi:homoserine dehydrogenase